MWPRKEKYAWVLVEKDLYEAHILPSQLFALQRNLKYYWSQLFFVWLLCWYCDCLITVIIIIVKTFFYIWNGCKAFCTSGVLFKGKKYF